MLLLATLFTVSPGCNAMDAFEDESKPLPTRRKGEIPSTAFVLTRVTDTKDKEVGGWWSGCLRLACSGRATTRRPTWTGT